MGSLPESTRSISPEEFRELYREACHLHHLSHSESLERLKEESGYDAEEANDDRQLADLHAGVLHWLTTLTVEQLAEELDRTDPETCARFREALFDARKDAARAVGLAKVLAAYFTAAAKEGAEDVKVSSYLHVLDLRKATGNEISTRALARMLKVDESTIRRWDGRAEELKVTREDFDEERLRKVVKPPRRRKRAPP
jgi:hypothetical protein